MMFGYKHLPPLFHGPTSRLIQPASTWWHLQSSQVSYMAAVTMEEHGDQDSVWTESLGIALHRTLVD